MKVTWNKNNKKRSVGAISQYPDLPFERESTDNNQQLQQHGADTELKKDDNQQTVGQNQDHNHGNLDSDSKRLADSFQAQGNKLAEDGKYREALGKWEAALNLMPENAVLHEQKAQVLLEFGDAWKALNAATRATELEPSWAEAWVTLGRAQLNFGELDTAIESFDRALAIKEVSVSSKQYFLVRYIKCSFHMQPGSEEAKDDRQTALHLVKRWKQLHSSGLSADKNCYMVGDKSEISEHHI